MAHERVRGAVIRHARESGDDGGVKERQQRGTHRQGKEGRHARTGKGPSTYDVRNGRGFSKSRCSKASCVNLIVKVSG